jgi:hypothetical protein
VRATPVDVFGIDLTTPSDLTALNMQVKENVRNGSSSLMIPQALSKAQERKAVEYVEDSFMDITSAFKKRSAVNVLRKL